MQAAVMLSTVTVVSRCLQPASQRTVVLTGAAAAGSLASGTMMRVLGVEVPYSYVIGTGAQLAYKARAFTRQHCHYFHLC
jgi:hypothetical protein